jgi:hypothetical protein
MEGKLKAVKEDGFIQFISEEFQKAQQLKMQLEQRKAPLEDAKRFHERELARITADLTENDAGRYRIDERLQWLDAVAKKYSDAPTNGKPALAPAPEEPAQP